MNYQRAKTYALFLVPFAVYGLFFFIILYKIESIIGTHYDVDSFGYDRIARTFSHNWILCDPRCPEKVPLQPIGYSLFLGSIYKLLGYSPIVIVIVQFLLSCISGILIYAIASRLFNGIIGLISFLLFSVNVGFLTFPHFILSETLHVLILLLFWFFFIRKNYDIAGLCLGISIYVKSTVLLYIPLCAVGLFLREGYGAVCTTIKFLCAAYLPIIGYMTYNYYCYGFFRLAPVAQLNIYQVFFSKVLSFLYGNKPCFYAQSVLAFHGEHLFDDGGWSHARDLFFKVLYEHPLTCCFIWIQNVIKSAFGLFSMQLKIAFDSTLKGGSCSFFLMTGPVFHKLISYIWYGIQSRFVIMITLYEAIWSLVRIPLIAIGIYRSIWSIDRIILVLICIYIVQCLFITGFDGCARYRLVIEPFLLIFTAVGLYRLKRV